MKRILISLLYEPGTSHLSSIESRAEQALEYGAISAMPTISVKPSDISPFWYVVLDIKAEDWPYWIGFAHGKDFAANNRQIAVGCN